MTDSATKPTPKPVPAPALERKQDWIVAIKLTETIADVARGRWMSQESLGYTILEHLQEIEGLKVQQVRAFADGPTYI